VNAPNCPPTVAALGDGPTRTAAPAGGPNPARMQADLGRQSFAVGLTADAVDDTRTAQPQRLFHGDVPAPRVFNRRPTQLVDSDAVNAEPNATLPGRIAPTAWDGEAGPGSPMSQGVW